MVHQKSLTLVRLYIFFLYTNQSIQYLNLARKCYDVHRRHYLS